MNAENRCPQCGAELAANAPRGLCPACLLKGALASQTSAAGGAQSAGGTDFVPPTSEQLAAQFPDLEILEFIGRGGMGMVYKARQKHLDRLVALKILLPSIAQDAAFAERFAREARAMAMLSHPHIVTVHDFGQTTAPLFSGEGKGEDSLYYFVMEFVDGLTLRQLLDAGKLAPREALAIVPQICEALQFAHDKGVVHRDIKPENILMDRSGQVKIADFGLAKLVGRDTKDFTISGAGQVMGTPHYMAPEQVEHPQEVDHRADIYSLGVVFYQMLTGELPIGRFAPPSRKVQIDVRLDEVVLRALEKEPDRRYQQASELKTQVETISTTPSPGVSDSHTGAVNSPRPASSEPGASRRLNVRTLSASIIVLVASVLITVGSFIQHGDTQLFVQAVGCLVGVIGLGGWFTAFKGHDGISPLIIVFAAVVLVTVGSFIQHGDTKLFVQTVGCLVGVIGLGGWFIAFNSQRSDAPPPRTGEASGTPAFPRLSGLAIAGAVWAPFGLLVLGAHLAIAPPSQQAELVVGLKLLAFTLLAAGLTAPFGTTILGLASLSQIRRSAGRLYGLGLALFDALLYPLLILDGLIGWFWYAVFSFIAEAAMRASETAHGHGELAPSLQLVIALTLLTSAVVDYFIARAAWRAASSATGSASAPPAADTQRRDSPRQSTAEAGGTPAFPCLSRHALIGVIWTGLFCILILIATLG